MGNCTLRARHFQRGCTTVHAHQRAALAPGTPTALVLPCLHQSSGGKLYLTFYFTVLSYYKYTSVECQIVLLGLYEKQRPSQALHPSAPLPVLEYSCPIHGAAAWGLASVTEGICILVPHDALF